MDNEYPNDEFVKLTAEFRDVLNAFSRAVTTTDEMDKANMLYDDVRNKAYDLALFIQIQESAGYRLVKADADPVQAVAPDDDPWLDTVLSDDREPITQEEFLERLGEDNPDEFQSDEEDHETMFYREYGNLSEEDGGCPRCGHQMSCVDGDGTWLYWECRCGYETKEFDLNTNS